MIAKLGSIVFEGLMGLTRMEVLIGGRYKETDLAMRPKRRTFSSADVTTITLQFRVHVGFKNTWTPKSMREYLESVTKSGQSIPFYSVDRNIWFNAYLLPFQETVEAVSTVGEVVSSVFNLTIEEQSTDDLSKSEQIQAIEQATSNNPAKIVPIDPVSILPSIPMQTQLASIQTASDSLLIEKMLTESVSSNTQENGLTSRVLNTLEKVSTRANSTLKNIESLQSFANQFPDIQALFTSILGTAEQVAIRVKQGDLGGALTMSRLLTQYTGSLKISMNAVNIRLLLRQL